MLEPLLNQVPNSPVIKGESYSYWSSVDDGVLAEQLQCLGQADEATNDPSSSSSSSGGSSPYDPFAELRASLSNGRGPVDVTPDDPLVELRNDVAYWDDERIKRALHEPPCLCCSSEVIDRLNDDDRGKGKGKARARGRGRGRGPKIQHTSMCDGFYALEHPERGPYDEEVDDPFAELRNDVSLWADEEIEQSLERVAILELADFLDEYLPQLPDYAPPNIDPNDDAYSQYPCAPVLPPSILDTITSTVTLEEVEIDLGLRIAPLYTDHKAAARPPGMDKAGDERSSTTTFSSSWKEGWRGGNSNRAVYSVSSSSDGGPPGSPSIESLSSTSPRPKNPSAVAATTAAVSRGTAPHIKRGGNRTLLLNGNRGKKIIKGPLKKITIRTHFT